MQCDCLWKNSRKISKTNTYITAYREKSVSILRPFFVIVDVYNVTNLCWLQRAVYIAYFSQRTLIFFYSEIQKNHKRSHRTQEKKIKPRISLNSKNQQSNYAEQHLKSLWVLEFLIYAITSLTQLIYFVVLASIFERSLLMHLF